MRVDVKCRPGPWASHVPAVREHVRAALECHGSRIRRVFVLLEAGGSGSDVLCHLDVQGEHAWRVIVEEVSATAIQAAERAAARASHSVARTFERSRFQGLLPWPVTRAT